MSVFEDPNDRLRNWQVDIRTNGTMDFLPDNLPNVNGSHYWHYYNQTALPSTVPTKLDSPTQLLFSRNFNASKVTHNESWTTLQMLNRVRPWLDIPGSFVTGDPEDWWTFDGPWTDLANKQHDLAPTDPYGALACPEPECTSHLQTVLPVLFRHSPLH